MALTPLVAHQLYGVTTSDPLTLTGVSVSLIAVALLAALIPARRVPRVDPATTLRCD